MSKKVKKQKEEKIDPRTARQIDILKRHYTVDTERKIIDVDFSYDTASEIFRDNVNPDLVPMVNHELIDNVTYFFDRIPSDYQISLNYQIDELEDYSFNEIAESYFDELELDHCLACKRSKSTGLRVAVLMIVGCALLVVYALCSIYGCFDDITGSIIGYIMDTAAAALIFEALGILFLYKDDEMVNNHTFLDKVTKVSFADKDGKKVISQTKEEITKNWFVEFKKDRFAKGIFLAAGIALSVLGLIVIISFLGSIKSINFQNSTVVTYLCIHLLCATFEILAGIGCISKYLGKGPLMKIVLPTMIIFAASIIVDTVLMFTILSKTGADTKDLIISTIFSLLIIGLLIVESIYLKIRSSKAKKK